MNKIFHVALREFLSTVATKGFIVGILVVPLMIGAIAVVMPRLMNNKVPKVVGEVAIIDPTGIVAAPLQDYLRPEEIQARRGELMREGEEQTPEQVRVLMASTGKDEVARRAMEAILGEAPDLTINALSSDSDLESAKEALFNNSDDVLKRLALVVVQDDAVTRKQGAESFGVYDLYVREKLDDRIEREIKRGVSRTIIEARIANEGLDRSYIEELTTVETSRSITVTAEGEKKTNQVFNMLLPMAFMGLLLMSVMTGGQQIMTTTIEEKSSRVVEVLLSAVSPMQFMTGKIIGQMCVGFTMLGVYIGIGIVSLIAQGMLGLLDLWLLPFLFIFYLIAYFTIASFMAAIGAAVNEMREAQSLMMPVMLTVMIPWMLWLPITRDPNSMFATILTFIPPVGSFVTILRMSTNSPPPFWQIGLSILVGLGGVWAALKFAAKIFRIGLLMHGKPPNFKTLIKWVRMA